MLLRAQGHLAKAEPLYREALDGFRAKLGKHRKLTLATIDDLAELLEVKGCLEEAERLHREALDVRRARLGSTHPAS